MKMRVEVPRTAPGRVVNAREAQRIERRCPKPKAVGSSPTTRTIAGLVQRKNACPTSRLRGFDSCTRHQFKRSYPGIAQLAEHAIDNREVVGSIPTPWTIFERASPSGKAPGFQPGIAWVRVPPTAPLRLKKGSSSNSGVDFDCCRSLVVYGCLLCKSLRAPLARWWVLRYRL